MIQLPDRVSYPRLRQRIATDGSPSTPGYLGMTIGEIRQLVQQATLKQDTYIPAVKPEAPKTDNKDNKENKAENQTTKASKESQPAAKTGYSVKSSDTLWKIAQNELGSGTRWKEIYELNQNVIKDPNQIYPGMVLKLPGKTEQKEQKEAKKTEKTEKPAETKRVESKPQASHSTLRQGSKGDEVKTLQEKLRAHGCDPGTIDGDFGPKTLAAVKAFQQNQGLEVDGIVGPKTWAALEGAAAATKTTKNETVGSGPTIHQGDQGEPVKKLQQRLKDLGFDPGPIDGDCGPKTIDAVKAFQRKKGLEADGIVGPNTWSKLGIQVGGTVSHETSSSSSSASSASGGSGPTIHQGDQGEPVKKLQQRLKDLGFDPGPIDGDCGPKTIDAVKAFQRKKGLEADGIVGPNTWGKLGIHVEGSVSASVSPSKSGSVSGNAIVQGALSLHNSGYRYPPNLTSKYYHSPGKVGCCADFVCDSIRETGFDIGRDMVNKGYNPHYCPSMIDYFRKYEQLRSASQPMQPGDILFFDWDGGGQNDPDHVAVVTKVDGNGRPTQLAESRHFGARTEISSISPGDNRSRCIVGVGRV